MQTGAPSMTGAIAGSQQTSMRQFVLAAARPASAAAASSASSSDAHSAASSSNVSGTLQLAAPVAPATPSSLAFARPSDSSAAQQQSQSQRRRRSKRDRQQHEAENEEGADAADGSMCDDNTAPPLAVSRLASRMLLYQLHVLRRDEVLLLRGVEGAGSGVHCRVANAEQAEAEAQAQRRALAREQRAAAAASSSSSSSRPRSLSGEEEKVPHPSLLSIATDESKEDIDGQEEEPDEALSPLSSSLSASSHPLFPDRLEWVSLFLSPSAAHAAFERARETWAARGVRGVKERIMEFQLTHPVRVLIVDEQQATTGSSSGGDAAARMSDEAPSISAAPSASSSTATTSPSLPSLYIDPTLPPFVRRHLSRNEDTLDGYCVATRPLSSFPPSLPPEVSESCPLHGEIVLRGSVCATSLQLVDDDKKARVSQQLLTDLLARMQMSKRATKGASGGSNGRASAFELYDSMDDDAPSSSSSAAAASLPPSSSLATAAAASSPLSPHSTVNLAPSSFSSELQTVSEQMFASPTAPQVNNGGGAWNGNS